MYGATGYSSSCSSIVKLLSEAVFRPVITDEEVGCEMLPYLASFSHMSCFHTRCRLQESVWHLN